MLSEMDKTVDKEGSFFGDKTQYVDTFKSIAEMFDALFGSL